MSAKHKTSHLPVEEIDRLRFQAFRSNSQDDVSAYHNAASAYFQDRIVRAMNREAEAADLLTAMTAERDALEKRQYALAYAIAGGEDAPGLLDSVSTDDLCAMIRSERAQERDAQKAWAKIAATVAREAALREVGEKLYQRFYPQNEQSDWTEFAKVHAAAAIEARQLAIALIDKGDTA